MNVGPLEDAIYDRLSGDTGAGGLLETGNTLVGEISNVFRKPESGFAKPIVVFRVEGLQQQDVAAGEMMLVQVTVNVLDDYASGPADCRLAVGRIFGDAAAQGVGVGPTFGLHRWQVGALSSGAGTVMRGVDSDTNHDTDFWEYIETYQVEYFLAFS